ncbi:MAG: GntR family transcriptional regulator [Chloroflexi bacterium]|nr:GntR family transcriptional regulator [Chloroflexota bacterium]
MSTLIDLDSHIPYYVQVKDVLRGRMKDGTWGPGDRLPSEAELCAMFNVSRTVIRQALQDLIHEGLIKRRKGKGSFVAAGKINEQLFQKLTGFYQDMVEQGLEPVTTVLHQHVVPASSEVAARLELEPETQVLEIVRLRSVQSMPIVLVTTYLPYALAPNLLTQNLTNQSLYALLEARYQLYIARGRRTIQAVLAEGQEAKLLEVSKGAPLFRLDSTSYLTDGTPVEYYYAYHRGDRSQFEVELIRTREQAVPFEVVLDLPPSNRISTRIK